MSGIIGNLIENYRTHMEREKNRPFLEGVMAACALVATANGHISFAKTVRVDQILQTLKQLQVYDPHEGLGLFDDFSKRILESPEAGHETAFLAMEKVAKVPKNGTLMLRICMAVSEANTESQIADQIEIVTLCARLGIGLDNLNYDAGQPSNEFSSS